MVGMPGWQGHEAAGHFVPAVRRQREKNVHTCSSPSHSVQSPIPRNGAPPPILCGSSHLSYPNLETSYLHTEVCLLHSVKVTQSVLAITASAGMAAFIFRWMRKGRRSGSSLGIARERSHGWTGRQNISAHRIPFVSLSSQRVFLWIGSLVDLS